LAAGPASRALFLCLASTFFVGGWRSSPFNAASPSLSSS
jgi:hypothetical protein